MGRTPAKPLPVTLRQDGSNELHPEPKKDLKIQRLRQGRFDSFVNSQTGLGDPTRDKRTFAGFYRQPWTYQERREFWRADSMAARIVERVAEDMTRKGWQVKVAGNSKAAEAMEQALRDLDVKSKFEESLRNQRGFGGGAIVLGIKDGSSDPSRPLNMKAIQSVDFLTTLAPVECQSQSFYRDPLAPKFGETDFFRLCPMLATIVSGDPQPLVHESRVLQFQGHWVSRVQLQENYGWGDSILDRIYDTVRDFQTSWDSSAALLQDFNQPVFKMVGLADALAGDDGTQKLQNRLMAMDMARSIIRALVLDKEEDFQKLSTSLTGLPETLDRWCKRLASEADMPVAMLMGDSPSGMNSTGDAETDWYHQRIHSRQEKDLLKPLTRLVKCLFLAKNGPTGGVEPKNWSIVFNPLQQVDPKDEAQRKLFIAQADAAYIAAGVISAEEVAESRFGGDEFGEDINLDTKLRGGFQEAIDRKTQNTVGEEDPEEALKRAVAVKTAQPEPKAGEEPVGPDDSLPEAPKKKAKKPAKE